MSIKELAAKIQFGVAAPAYQSKSSGTDFEDILLKIQEELKTVETHYKANLLSTDSLSPKKQHPSSEQTDLLGLSPLFKMDAAEFSLLDDLLMMALEDTQLAKQAKQATGEEANNPEFQVSERYRMDLSKIGGLLTKLA
ncbi:hypothetical protein NB640_00115 [Oxalobacter vibrioformis]|uniref:Uncharacterized protein n=1 Tax=Oxalobacter vibrioformis TaxID=933080 RepID=A0A9E9LVT0_9BURK|nr:hypothetical protein [Oxalobacter vibrioformis]WAW10116.1 hypothetical protein NB640_00115 [Oxalobacter vibrioformis]